MTPRRVLMVGPDVTAIGGMASVTLALARCAELDPDWDVEVINSGGGRGREGWSRYPNGLRAAAAARFDVMHLHVAQRGSTWRKATFAALARLRRRPYVIHVHGSSYADFARSLQGAQRVAVRRFFQGAAQVITLGEGLRDMVVDTLGCAPDHVVVITNGVAEVAPDARREQSILFLGEIGRRKGVDLLTAALPGVLGPRSEWSITLAGPVADQELEANLEALARRFPGQVHLPGPRMGPEKDALLARASIFALPSRNEGLPMAMLEAMSASLPVVVTPVGAIGEVLQDGQTGVLVPVEDADALAAALGSLADDPDLRARVGGAAHELWRTRFSDQAMYDAVRATWQRALAS